MEENGPIKSNLIKNIHFYFFINIKNPKLFLFNNSDKKINLLKIFALTKYFFLKILVKFFDSLSFQVIIRLFNFDLTYTILITIQIQQRL